MKKSLVILIAMTFCALGFAQSGAILIGEGRKDQVRLRWNVPSWKYDYVGVVVKRRVYDEKKAKKWDVLTQKVVYPAIDGSRDLSSATNSEELKTTLRDLFKQKVDAGVWSVKDSSDLIVSLRKEGTNQLKLLLGLNFKLSLISGFAYVDEDIKKPKGKVYEYGVFVVKRDGSEVAPIETFKWEWGTSPEYDVQVSPRITSNRKKTKIKARWSVDTESFLTKKVLLGFNIYKRSTSGLQKINDGVLYPNASLDESLITSFDELNSPTSTPISYEIHVVSAFNTEQFVQVAEYAPESVPTNFEVMLDTIYDLVEPNNQNVRLEWSFPENQERFIERVEVYKGINGVSSMTLLTDTVSPSSRFFDDIDFKKNEDRIDYKVMLYFKDDFLPVETEPKEFRYYRIFKPFKATNFTGAYVIENGKRVIRFNYDAPDDEQLLGYKLLEYMDSSRWVSHQAKATKGPIVEEVSNYICQKKIFAVQGLTKNFVAGPISDSIEVIIGGEFIQRVYPKWRYNKADHNVTLMWDYDIEKYSEVIGYRIYMDGKLLANENAVVASQRSFLTTELDYGWHQFEMVAVSKYGTLSEPVPTQKLFIRKYY